MKKGLYILFVLLMTVSLALAGCAGGAEEPAPAPDNGDDNGADAPADEPLRVALVLPGPINDGGWNTTGYNGLLAIEEEFGAEIAFNESTPVSDYAEVFRNYALAGFDIVIGHSSNFADTALEVAPEFPDTHFVVTSTSLTQDPNVSSINNDNAQQGFMAGAVAAILSESGVVAGIGSMEIVSIVNSMIGFEAGAKYVNPDITVYTTYTGSHDDAAGAKELAFSFIDQGADVFFPNANAASLGVIEAAEEQGALIIGSIGDMAPVSPNTVVTSARTALPVAFVAFVEEYLSPGFQPGAYNYGLNEDVVFLAPYGEFEDVLTQEQKDAIDEILDGIRSGEIDAWELGDF